MKNKLLTNLNFEEIFFILNNNDRANELISYLVDSLVRKNYINKFYNKDLFQEQIVEQQLQLLCLTTLKERIWQGNYDSYHKLNRFVVENILWIEDVFLPKYIVDNFLSINKNEIINWDDAKIDQFNAWISDDNSSAYNSLFSNLNDVILLINRGGILVYNNKIVDNLEDLVELIKHKINNHNFILRNILK